MISVNNWGDINVTLILILVCIALSIISLKYPFVGIFNIFLNILIMLPIITNPTFIMGFDTLNQPIVAEIQAFRSLAVLILLMSIFSFLLGIGIRMRE